MLTQGQQVTYVELKSEEDGKSGRYALPDSTLLAKLFGLIGQFPTLMISHQGLAKIKSEARTDHAYQPLAGIPSSVDYYFDAELMGHPVLPQGTLRYSSALVEFIQEVGSSHEISQNQVASVQTSNETQTTAVGDSVPHESSSSSHSPAATLTESLKSQIGTATPPPPAAPLVSLADQFQQQLSQKASQKTIATKQPSSFLRQAPEDVHPLSESGVRIKDEIASAPRLKQVIIEEHDDPIQEVLARIDDLQDIVDEIAGHMLGSEIGAKDLQAWFIQSLQKVGWDETFNRMAKQIRFI